MRLLRPVEAWLCSVPCAALAVWIMTIDGWSGDYGHDAGRAFDRALSGDLTALLHGAEMGPMSLIARYPFVWVTDLAGGGPLAQYRVGSIALMAIVSGLILWCACRLVDRPLNRVIAAVVALMFVNPFTASALEYGHPEELFTAALIIAGFFAGIQGRIRMGWVLIALGVLSKQWAVVAVAPYAVAVGVRPTWRWARLAVAGLGVSIVALVLIDADFLSRQAGLITSNHFIRPDNVWWLFVPGVEDRVLGGSLLADVVNYSAHGLIVVASVVVALIAAKMVRVSPESQLFSIDQALGLIGVVLVLRCALDPWNIDYYFVPAFLVLLVWASKSPRRLALPLAVALYARVLVEHSRYFGGDDLRNVFVLTLATSTILWAISCMNSNIRPWGQDPRVKFRQLAPISVK